MCQRRMTLPQAVRSCLPSRKGVSGIMKIETVGFIGLGLIGGSIAKAIKLYHPQIRIMAYLRNRETLEQAARAGTIDQDSTAVNDAF